LGYVEVTKDKVLCFTAPLLGFESFRKYALLPAPGAKPFFVLQSLETPQLAFPVVRAEELSLVYRARPCASLVSAEDLRRVAATTPDEVTCWIVVAMPTDGSPLRLNLRAPLVVNEKKQLAAQVVIGEECAPCGKWVELEIGRIHDVNRTLADRTPSPNVPVSQSSSVVAY